MRPRQSGSSVTLHDGGNGYTGTSTARQQKAWHLAPHMATQPPANMKGFLVFVVSTLYLRTHPLSWEEIECIHMWGDLGSCVSREKAKHQEAPQTLLPPNTEARAAGPPPPSHQAGWAAQPAWGGAGGQAGHSTGSEGQGAAAVGVAFPGPCAQGHDYASA